MAQELITTIKEMDKSQLIELTNFLGANLLAGLDDEDLSGKISPELQGHKKLKEIMNLEEDVMLENIAPSESADIAREFLLFMAHDDQLAPVVEKALSEFKEEEVLIVETILSIGIAASLLIFMSTTEVEGKIFGLRIKKKAATAEQIKAILEPFSKIIPNLKRGA